MFSKKATKIGKISKLTDLKRQLLSPKISSLFASLVTKVATSFFFDVGPIKEINNRVFNQF